MANKYACVYFQDLIYLIDAVQDLMGGNYSVHESKMYAVDALVIEYKPNPHAGNNAHQYITAAKAQDIIFNAKSDEEAANELYNYFWGFPQPTKNELPKGAGNKLPENCVHDWVEVTLFVTPQLRCKHCDIKKSSGGTSETP